MVTLEENGMAFLLICPGWWGKGTDLLALKQEGSRKGKWLKGEKRKYRCFLVQAETEIVDEGRLLFSSELAMSTAIDLGVV
jgi:hypothetical protein